MLKNLRKKLFIAFIASSVLLTSALQVLANGYVTFHTSERYLKHINRGYIALDQFNYALALKEFSTARYIDDTLFAAHEGLALIYELTRNNSRALESYQKAVNLIAPKYAGFYLNKIKKLRQEQEIKKALVLYRNVLSIRPEAGLQMLLGDKSMGEGRYNDAVKYYRQAYVFQEDPEEYLKYIDVKYTNKEYERYVIRKYIQDGLSYPEAHFKAGMAHFRKRDYEAAIKEFSVAVSQIKVRTAENEYVNYLAQAYFKAGLLGKMNLDYLNKAIENFDEALNYDPENPELLFSLANAYYYRDVAKMNAFDKELEEAEKGFARVADFSTNDPEYRDAKSTLDSILSKKYSPAFFEDSYRAVQRIQGMKLTTPDFHYYLGNIFMKKAMIYHKGYYDRHKFMNAEKASARDRSWDYYDQAMAEYRNYLNKKPKNDGLIYYDIGVLYYHRSKLEANAAKLPVTETNKKEYQRYGAKFYRRDMLNHALSNFRTYLYYHPRAANAGEVRALMGEMQLALVSM